MFYYVPNLIASEAPTSALTISNSFNLSVFVPLCVSCTLCGKPPLNNYPLINFYFILCILITTSQKQFLYGSMKKIIFLIYLIINNTFI